MGQNQPTLATIIFRKAKYNPQLTIVTPANINPLLTTNFLLIVFKLTMERISPAKIINIAPDWVREIRSPKNKKDAITVTKGKDEAIVPTSARLARLSASK